MPGETIRIRGLRELNTAFAHAGRQARTELRATWREVAVPVKRDAQELAGSKIRNIGTKWPVMRVGITRKVVYVAPKQRGVKKKGDMSRRRPNLAPLMMDRAMEPALNKNRGVIEYATVRALDHIADTFNGRRI